MYHSIVPFQIGRIFGRAIWSKIRAIYSVTAHRCKKNLGKLVNNIPCCLIPVSVEIKTKIVKLLLVLFKTFLTSAGVFYNHLYVHMVDIIESTVNYMFK